MLEIQEGFVTFYIGQNSSDNDFLFNNMPSDSVWFHLDDGPSAHVYAVSERKISVRDKKRAAVLVRQFSKGQGKVIYLPKQSLKLIGGGKVELLSEPNFI
jgi:predicted ribosome quality control (RQC) complex YloA/Tae2 family protein